MQRLSAEVSSSAHTLDFFFSNIEASLYCNMFSIVSRDQMKQLMLEHLVLFHRQTFSVTPQRKAPISRFLFHVVISLHLLLQFSL